MERGAEGGGWGDGEGMGGGDEGMEEWRDVGILSQSNIEDSL